MLNIRITGISNGGLKLDGNGHSIAYGPEDVQWEVLDNTGVSRIVAITWKDISGSTNVFPAGYPRARNPQQKVWYAKVNRYDSEYVYVYTITWADADGNTQDFDPIISIKPTTIRLIYILSLLVSAVVALFTFKFLRRNRK